MDDSEKSLNYLVAVESLAEEILSDKTSIIFLDKRRNENREALRAIQKQIGEQISKVNSKDKRCWLSVGSNLFKFSSIKTIELIEKDQKQLEQDINKLRSELKVKVNKLRDLEHRPPVPGLTLVPLSKTEEMLVGHMSAY